MYAQSFVKSVANGAKLMNLRKSSKTNRKKKNEKQLKRMKEKKIVNWRIKSGHSTVDCNSRSFKRANVTSDFSCMHSNVINAIKLRQNVECDFDNNKKNTTFSSQQLTLFLHALFVNIEKLRFGCRFKRDMQQI